LAFKLIRTTECGSLAAQNKYWIRVVLLVEANSWGLQLGKNDKITKEVMHVDMTNHLEEWG
jgi:hypothetical protein